jgi:hypothetical protein
MIFQIFDLLIDLSLFKARRAQMLTVECHVTQSAKKPAAGCTRNAGLFARVIKAAGLSIHLKRCTGTTHRQRSVNGRENIDPQKVAAGTAGNQRIGIGRRLAQWCIAVGAVKHGKSL